MLIPGPGETNKEGAPLDVLRYLRTKRELGQLLLPFLYSTLKEAQLLGETDPELQDLIRQCEEVARMWGIDLTRDPD